jgi:phospholipid transport system substrate-binding protein
MKRQINLNRLWVLFSLMLCVLSKPVFSDEAALKIAVVQNPVEMLESVTNRVLAELKSHQAIIKANPKKIYDVVNFIVLPHVDFVEMAKWVVGRNAWKAADTATKKEFVQAFKTMIVRTYARSLLEYTDQTIEFLPLRETLGSQPRIQVASVIEDNGQTTHIDYYLLRESEDWKIYDIVIEGVSLIQGYRAQFADDVRQGGVAAVLEAVRRHNQEGQSTRE